MIALPLPYRWVCLGVMCLGYLLAMVARFGTAVIAPELISEFSLGPAELAFLAALYLWGYAAMQIPAGVLSDTLGPRRTVAMFMLVAAVGMGVFALAQDNPMNALGRGLTGVGTGLVYVCTAKLLTQLFRPNEFATLNGMIIMVGNVGTLTAAAPLALLVGAVGWRASFLVLTGFCALTAVLVFTLVLDKPPPSLSARVSQVRFPSPTRQPGRWAAGEAIRTVLRDRNMWLLAIFAFASYGPVMAIQGLWAVPYLMDIHGLTRQDASNLLTLWPLGTIIGCPLSGYLSDHVLRTRKWVGCGGFLLLSLQFLIIALRPADLPVWAFSALFFFGGLGGGSIVVPAALLNDVMPRQVVGTALGIYNLWFFIGSGVYQQLTGAILSAFPAATGQGSVEGYRLVFIACLIGAWTAAAAVAATREKKVARVVTDAST